MGLILEGSQPLLPAAADATVTSTDITDSTAVGRSVLTAATAAIARAAIGVSPWEITTYDFATSTGFVLNDGTGGGSATITAGVARLSNPAGTAQRPTGGGVYQGPSIYRALPAVTDTFDVAVRLANIGTLAGSVATLEVSNAAASGIRIDVLVYPDTRNLLFYRADTLSVIESVAAAFASLTGEEWVRMRAIGPTVQAFYGVGVAGARPTTWTVVATTASITALWSHVAVGLSVTGTGAVATIDLDDLTVSAPEIPWL